MSFALIMQPKRLRHCQLAWRSLILVVLATYCVGALSAPIEWPELKLPANVAPFKIGDELEANGTSMRLLGFTSSLPKSTVTIAFREMLGAPLVESDTGQSHVVGRPLGDFYCTVQIESVASGSRGWITLTRPLSTTGAEDATGGELARLIDLLPSGTRVLNRTLSHERGAKVQTLMVANDASQSYNVERVVMMQRASGLSLERDASPSSAESGPRMLWFRGVGREGAAAIWPNPRGGVVLMITTVTSAGNKK